MQVSDTGHVKRVMTVLKNDGEAAKSEIAASWRRCLIVHQIDPARPRPANVLSASELRDAAEPIMPMLRIAEPEIARLFRLVRGAGYIILLSDYRGIAVAERGEERDCGPSGKRPLLGTVWDEKYEGTNGLGTALATRRQILVRRNDHLHSRNTDMICAAAPLYDHEGNLAGAIDITTFRGETADAYLPLALSVVTDAARRIEARCFSQAHPNAMILTLSECEAAGGSAPLIAVNSDHFVVGATRAARTARRFTDDMLSSGIPLREVMPSAEFDSPSLVDAERVALQQVLALTKNNVSAAAAKLGISRATMHRKLKRLESSGIVLNNHNRRAKPDA